MGPVLASTAAPEGTVASGNASGIRPFNLNTASIEDLMRAETSERVVL